ncbi:MAG: starch-binding protein [Prevotella sp.]|nr:starch-binding protein [Prevotella sp.]
MKRILFSLSFIICHLSFSPEGALAQGWPSQYGGVMLQGFYWDSYDDSQWTELTAQTDQLKGTFDLVWLPQSGYCGGQSMGYDDLYWFPGHYNSSFGTEEQLRTLIKTFKDNGIKTIADVVINHRRNLSSWTDFPAETYKGVTYQMTYNDICADDEAARNGHQVGPNKDTGEGWDGMRDLDHLSQNVQTSVKAYLDMLLNDMGYAGFRYDMVKGYSASFTGQYNTSAKPEFSVGECWDSSNTIRNWIDGTKVNDEIQSAAFDFQFRYTVRNAMNNANYARLNQQNEGNWPLVSSSYEQGKYRRYAVTFVENHDTERRSNAAQDPLKKDTLAANAYMLAMPGTPCVFLKHWQAYPSQIKAMVAARRLAGINNESAYANFRSAAGYFANIIKTNNENRLLVVVGDVAQNEANVNHQQWVKAVEGYHYAYYLPATMETAYADLPSGTYVGAQKVRLAAVTATEGTKLVYTLDGSNPTTASANVADGSTVSIPVGTTTLKVAMLIGSEVKGIVSRDYVVKEKESEKPVDIPTFCQVNDGEMCAFFEAPSTWTSTIKCWAWNNQANFTGGSWPGQECQLLGTASNGNKVWKWTYSGTLTTQPTGIIFNNNGSPQTDDLAFENGGYYTRDGLKGNVITASIADIARSTFNVQQPVYDLQGRPVKAINPRRGLYLREGKKLLMR